MRTTGKKSRKMLAAEEKLGGELERTLAPLITEIGQSAAAERLNIATASMGYWLLRLGIDVHRVALGPGDSLLLRRADGTETEIA